MHMGGWGFTADAAGELTALHQGPGPLAGGEGRCAVPINPAPRLLAFRTSSLSPRASDLRAPNLLLNHGPSEPSYATEAVHEKYRPPAR